MDLDNPEQPFLQNMSPELQFEECLLKYSDEYSKSSATNDVQELLSQCKAIVNGFNGELSTLVNVIWKLTKASKIKPQAILNIFDLLELFESKITQEKKRDICISFYYYFKTIFDHTNDDNLLKNLLTHYEKASPNDIVIYLTLIRHNLFNIFDFLVNEEIINPTDLIGLFLEPINFGAILSLQKNLSNFNNYVSSLPTHLQKNLNELLNYPDQSLLLLAQFNPHNRSKEQQSACLTSARKNASNSSSNLTILKGDELIQTELIKYVQRFNHISSLAQQEIFIITGHHWVAGVIEIGEDKKRRIFFSDSTTFLRSGGTKGSFSSYFKTSILPIFQDNLDHSFEFFFGAEKRQSDNTSCYLFALDDAEIYKKYSLYYKDNLFDYLTKNPKGSCVLKEQRWVVKSRKATFSSFPLLFLRSMQSRDLFNIIKEKPLSEQKLVINQKGFTAAEAANNDFKASDESKLQNKRFIEKSKKIASKNYRYILERSPEEVYEAMAQFTLEAFLKRHSEAPTIIIEETKKEPLAVSDPIESQNQATLSAEFSQNSAVNQIGIETKISGKNSDESNKITDNICQIQNKKMHSSSKGTEIEKATCGVQDIIADTIITTAVLTSSFFHQKSENVVPKPFSSFEQNKCSQA